MSCNPLSPISFKGYVENYITKKSRVGVREFKLDHLTDDHKNMDLEEALI